MKLLINKIFIRIKNMLWRIILKFFTDPNKLVLINGNIMHLDKKDSLLLSLRRDYEKDHVNLIKNIVKKGDYVVDVGAHIGYFTILLSNIVGLTGKVFAFEPNPEIFKILETNIKTNKHFNVVLEKKAVSNKNEKLALIFSKENSGDTRISKKIDFQNKNNPFIVNSITLDNYFKKIIKKIKFIKIDVQGAEYFVLQGMKKLLKNNDLKITIEFDPNSLELFERDAPKKILDLLRKNGFLLFDINKNQVISNDDAFIKFYKDINYFTTLYCYKKNPV